MHGDLYAHNILSTPTGDALLSDYGAASFFDVADSYQAQRLQRLEVRAFGCLLEELTERCHSLNSSVQIALRALIEACLQPEISCRPSFDDICGQLRHIERIA